MPNHTYILSRSVLNQWGVIEEFDKTTFRTILQGYAFDVRRNSSYVFVFALLRKEIVCYDKRVDIRRVIPKYLYKEYVKGQWEFEVMAPVLDNVSDNKLGMRSYWMQLLSLENLNS